MLLRLPMPAVVLVGRVPLAVMIAIMTMAMVFFVMTITIVVMVGSRLTGAAIVLAKEAGTRRNIRRQCGHLAPDRFGLLADGDELVELAPVQPHPFAPWADIDGDAKTFHFFHSFVADGTLHCVISFNLWGASEPGRSGAADGRTAAGCTVSPHCTHALLNAA